ncbi:hypothetical protein COY62_00555 [bacterium (Candidatus Howlettbacteria) CG_4_10_14_0_8_um_filter_40_9]|nr:MAG: hypothetical protein COY62_00555 [bacterium (Candidatus Howlettbacteria) CG_4_10_14_0_8_um_filter_40_9]
MGRNPFLPSCLPFRSETKEGHPRVGGLPEPKLVRVGDPTQCHSRHSGNPDHATNHSNNAKRQKKLRRKQGTQMVQAITGILFGLVIATRVSNRRKAALYWENNYREHPLQQRR